MIHRHLYQHYTFHFQPFRVVAYFNFLTTRASFRTSQGFVEDQFGLGLIARALEESIRVIKPSGSIIMNMGGRPGQAVLERLYERRGFNIRKVGGPRLTT